MDKVMPLIVGNAEVCVDRVDQVLPRAVIEVNLTVQASYSLLTPTLPMFRNPRIVTTMQAVVTAKVNHQAPL